MWVDTFFLIGKNGGIQGFDPSGKGMLWSINNHLLTKSSNRQCLYAEVWNTELPDVIGSTHMISILKISVLGTKPTEGLDAVYFSRAAENVVQDLSQTNTSKHICCQI